MERDPRVAAPERAWGRQGSQTVPDSLQGPQETLKKAPEGSGRLSTTLPRSQTCSKPVGNLSILPSRLFASDGLLRPPMSPQEAPRRIEKDPKTPPRSCQEIPKGFQEAPKRPSTSPGEPPKRLQKAFTGPPIVSKRPQEAPQGTQQASNRPSKAPKTPWGGAQEAPPNFQIARKRLHKAPERPLGSFRTVSSIPAGSHAPPELPLGRDLSRALWGTSRKERAGG